MKKAYAQLLTFLSELEERRITYTLDKVRPEAIMVLVAIPGERWEIEFLQDGSVDVERFISSGELEDGDALDRLLKVAV